MAGVVLAAVGCTRGAGAPDGPPGLTIIYSADLRGALAAPPRDTGGVARRATLVDWARLTARALVQVDAGDVVPSAEDDATLGEPAARAARARLALRAYRRLGMDAITVGERDLALGADELRSLCDEAKVPVVAANIVGSDGKLLFPAHRIVRGSGDAIGVFGVLDLRGQSWTPPAGVTVTDPVAAARAAVSSLRASGARVVVGLLHVTGGIAHGREIAVASGADLVVLGHGGPPTSPRIVWPGIRGAHVGRVDVRFTDRGVPRLEDHLLATGPDVPEQPGVRLLLRVADGPVAATFAESVRALSKAKGRRTFGEDWTYATTGLCVACHPTQAAQWRTTAHAHAFATLERTRHADEPACMGCHMTGFLLPGGAQNLETATAQFANVGCEACHGPSVAHIIASDKRKGTARVVDPAICLGCHTPDQNLGPFTVADAMKEVIGPGHGSPPSPAR